MEAPYGSSLVKLLSEAPYENLQTTLHIHGGPGLCSGIRLTEVS